MMTKFDSLNLTAPHTMRELEQTECETAATMRARKIAAMIEEDRWLDGECDAEAQLRALAELHAEEKRLGLGDA